jgi:hypothetical protein
VLTAAPTTRPRSVGATTGRSQGGTCGNSRPLRVLQPSHIWAASRTRTSKPSPGGTRKGQGVPRWCTKLPSTGARAGPRRAPHRRRPAAATARRRARRRRNPANYSAAGEGGVLATRGVAKLFVTPPRKCSGQRLQHAPFAAQALSATGECQSPEGWQSCSSPRRANAAVSDSSTRHSRHKR